MPTREQAQREAAPTADRRKEDGGEQKRPSTGASESAPLSGETGGRKFVPALLRPFRKSGAIRLDYPIFLAPPASGGEEEREEAAAWDLSPLPELLATLLPEEPAGRILRDNILRLERALRREIAASSTSSESPEALPLLREAA
ncbi:MAG TPA: hypothetical protein VKA53_01365, partial [Thermoanaerobaculia bacterium]|nr:hypothetical protein [Thermoanaerobaculia bacterium]